MLDTPFCSSDLCVILKRIEIYSNVPRRAKYIEEMSSSKTSDSEASAYYESAGEATFKFEVLCSQGPFVEIERPKFHRVAVEDIDMRSIGPIGASLHKIGDDAGREWQIEETPKSLFDLPPGFIDTKEPEI